LKYDIHRYWQNAIDKSDAFKLRQVLIENQVKTFTPVEKPIGPHPFLMFEAHARGVQLPGVEKLLITD
jgi:aromatic ring-cleaving dioxygenase